MLGEIYTVSEAMEAGWTIIHGVLIGKQVREEHGSVIRTEMDFVDIDLSFDFRLRGGTRFNLVIDDENEKSVHSGHICHVSISPKSLKVSDDKTGGMNLKVREMRKRSDLSSDEQCSLDTILVDSTSTVPITIENGSWHQLRVRLRGDIIDVFLDGSKITRLKSPEIAHQTKTKFGFTSMDSRLTLII